MSMEIAQAIVAKAAENIAPAAEAKPAESLDNNAVQSTDAEKSTNVDSDMAKRLAMIAKREKAMMESKSAWETEKNELLARLKALEEESGGYKSKVEALRNKEWDKLKDDLDFEDLAQYKINGEQPTQETILEKKLAEIEKKIELKLKEKDDELMKREAEKAERMKDGAVQQFKSKIKDDLELDFKSEDPKFQWLSVQEDPQDIVYGIIEEYYNKTEAQGKAIALTVEQASEMAEKYLEEEAERKFGKVKKAKTLIEKLFPTDQKQEGAKANPQTWGTKTLTNNVATPTERRESTGAMGYIDLEKSRSEAAKLLRFVDN